MTFVDLFCGIGGFRLAFESVDGTCVFSSDFDKNACTTYEQNFENYPLSDVSQLVAKELPDFDILCAGFPCQPFSIAGMRKGFQDTRGTLFFDVERIIREKKPKAFILENVKGLVNHDKGNTLNVILNTLACKINGVDNINAYSTNLKYHVFYKVLNSKDYGVPQNRERIYIIGFLNDGVKFDFPKPFDHQVSLNKILEKNVEGYKISETAIFNIHENLKKHLKFDNIKSDEFLLAYEIRKSKCSFRFDGLAPTLTAKMGTGGNNVPVLVQQMRKLTIRECLRIQGYPDSFKMKSNNSNSYKQIGNSVSVPVIKLLAKEIKKVLQQ